MDNILVFPCGSEIGLEIARSFKGVKGVKLIGGSSVDDHGRFVYENYIEGMPKVHDDKFIHTLASLVKENNIKYIFPAHDDVVLKLSENTNKLDCVIITSSFATCEIARSKQRTYEFFKNKLRVPKIYLSDTLSDDLFPVFLKPNIGQGTKGTYLAKSREEVNFYLAKNPNLLILEYLPGEEYTVDCFTDFNGELKFCGPRGRNRILNGISVNTTVCEGIDDFKKIAETINQAIEFDGCWFFQLKKSKAGEYTLLEIAPRVAGSTALYRNKGINLPVLSYYNKLKKHSDIIENSFDIEMDRALCSKFKMNLDYNTIYLDFDDCVYLNHKLNEDAIKLIIQAMNNNINIILLSKHKRNLKAKLKKLRIEKLFDQVIHIDQKKNKIDFITEKKAIFIDDSFSERKTVHDKYAIPVFSVDAIECLID